MTRTVCIELGHFYDESPTTRFEAAQNGALEEFESDHPQYEIVCSQLVMLSDTPTSNMFRSLLNITYREKPGGPKASLDQNTIYGQTNPQAD